MNSFAVDPVPMPITPSSGSSAIAANAALRLMSSVMPAEIPRPRTPVDRERGRAPRSSPARRDRARVADRQRVGERLRRAREVPGLDRPALPGDRDDALLPGPGALAGLLRIGRVDPLHLIGPRERVVPLARRARDLPPLVALQLVAKALRMLIDLLERDVSRAGRRAGAAAGRDRLRRPLLGRSAVPGEDDVGAGGVLFPGAGPGVGREVGLHVG